MAKGDYNDIQLSTILYQDLDEVDQRFLADTWYSYAKEDNWEELLRSVYKLEYRNKLGLYR